ncbi:MAG: flagellar biosynthesis protein FlhB [Proteobacteria bacterium]|nr:flagellar biosynthesis protein FlhB [Pseudomonadota bacterium]NBX86409.1 flagellar biosynthesis protein FlhB [Pseudomonadota bacterium]
MADDEDQGSKTEEPTEQKLRKLREDGNVPTSREVNNLFAILGMVILAGLAAPWGFGKILELAAAVIQNAGVTQLEDGASVGAALVQVFMTFLIALVPLLGILMVLGYLGGFLQNGAIYSTKPITPNLEKISPLAGFKRLFSLKSLAEFVKGIIKMLVVGAAIVMVVYGQKDSMLALINGEISDLLYLTQKMLLWVLGAALAVMIVLAIVDVLFQRFQFLKQHRMSRYEMKEEMRDSEGDPHMKARRRQIQRERSRKRMMANVPKADVVITNPTHYACALRYKPAEGDAAPILLAKGVDAVALRIREIAKENDIPLFEDRILARQLWQDVEIDDAIPVQLYEVVAKVIALVAKLKKA